MKRRPLHAHYPHYWVPPVKVQAREAFTRCGEQFVGALDAENHLVRDHEVTRADAREAIIITTREAACQR